MDTLSREEVVFSLNSVAHQEYNLRKAAFCLLRLDALSLQNEKGKKRERRRVMAYSYQTTSVLEIARV